MGKVGVLRKSAEAAQVGGMGIGMGAGGPQMTFLLGGGGVMDPNSAEFIQAYGQPGSPSHERAMRMQRAGRMGRMGLAGLGAFNAAYNQMASGEPGLGSAIGQGAMGGWYGSAGLENAAARMGMRGSELSRNHPAIDEFMDAARGYRKDRMLPAPTIHEPWFHEEDVEEGPKPTPLLAEPYARMDPINAAMSQIEARRQDIQDHYATTAAQRRAEDIARNF